MLLPTNKLNCSHHGLFAMIVNPSYSQEDIQEILNIALTERSTLGTDLPHAQLLEIAQELGISTETIEVAKD
jgi:hypothetical protein